jgi:hypothetical protein
MRIMMNIVRYGKQVEILSWGMEDVTGLAGGRLNLVELTFLPLC